MTDNNTPAADAEVALAADNVITAAQRNDEFLTVDLPISGYKVTLRRNIFYHEYKALDAVMLKATKGVLQDGKMSQEFDGTAHQAYERKMLETFIVKCEDPANGKLVQINILLNTNFAVADGILLEDTVADLYAEIKKNLPKK